jgi:hypothetical protein
MNKKITFTPTLTSIIEPTAKLLGSELKNFIEEKINTWKKIKREENIIKHIERAREIKEDIQVDTESIQQLDQFQEWAKYAQDIDYDDDILGKMWQDLLISIIENKNSPDYLIKKLKSLSKEEALLLIKTNSYDNFSAKTEKEQFLLKKLYLNELVVKVYNKIAFQVTVFTSIMLLLFNGILGYQNYFKINIAQFSLNGMILIYIIILFIFGYKFIKNTKIKGFATYELSWIGKELIKSIPKKII